MIDNQFECPDKEKFHTPCPETYRAWHAWAEAHTKTHRPTKCPTCGFWSVWVRKKDHLADVSNVIEAARKESE